jgi:endonuclease-3
MADLKLPSRRSAKGRGMAAKPARTPRSAAHKALSDGEPGRVKAVADAPHRHPPDPVDPARVRAIFERLRADRPEPKGELEHTNPFTLLIAVVLSAQSTDAGVNRATRTLFSAADTPAAMLALGEAGVREHIRTINFLNTKARNVIALSRRLVEEFGGAVPADVSVLETLPGVGRKTASVVANVAFAIPRIAVDTHILRVATRIPLATAATPLEMQEKLETLVPEEFLLHAHHWLILHGRYTCKARLPECWRCPISDLCRYEQKSPPPAVTAPI